jgi:4-hydroxybenzoyl-CoA thioesterase
MFSNRRNVRIEWGDCDPAGIVFYPRYFAMFDHSTVLLIERALGMSKHQLCETYDFAGYPSVATRARFLIPSSFGDDVVIESAITEIGRSSFSLTHRLTKDGALAVEGSDTRAWVVRDPSRPGGLRAVPLPDGVVARFKADPSEPIAPP